MRPARRHPSKRPADGAGRGRGLRLKSFAKINLGLEVLGRRQDGYHELRTLFQTIDLYDEIRLRPGGREVRVLCDHPLVPRDGTNLAFRAAEALRRHAGLDRGIEIVIDKRIPVGGGLGGGSSNAAAVLRGLDLLWGLDLGASKLNLLARQLGADVPYFLVGGTALGLGRGDEVYPLRLQIQAHVVVVMPGISVSTAEVFRRADESLTPRENSNTIFRFVSSDLEGSCVYEALSNDLEEAALEHSADLARQAKRIRGTLVREGARLAALSGSGSSYFGVFDDAQRARQAQEALAAEGFIASRARTLSLDQYRRIWTRSLGRGAPGADR